MSGPSCMCVLEVSIFQLSTILILDFGTVPTGWWCLLFILVCKVKKNHNCYTCFVWGILYIACIIINTTFIDEIITFTINPRYLQLIDTVHFGNFAPYLSFALIFFDFRFFIFSHYLSSLVILHPNTFKLFGFPIFQFWAYLTKVIPETFCAH